MAYADCSMRATRFYASSRRGEAISIWIASEPSSQELPEPANLPHYMHMILMRLEYLRLLVGTRTRVSFPFNGSLEKWGWSLKDLYK